MRSALVSILTLLAAAGCTQDDRGAAASPAAPAAPTGQGTSAEQAIAAIEACMHWGGEEPYDEKRAQFIAESAKRDCEKAVALAQQRYAQLAADAKGALGLVDLTTNLASQYGANRIVAPGEMKQLCLTAEREVRRRLAADAEEVFPYFDLTCSKHTGVPSEKETEPMTQSAQVHTHHAIDYIEIAVGDVSAAKRFYGGAFGWSFNDYGPEYAGIRGEGSEVGGLRRDDVVRAGGPLVILYSRDLEATLEGVVKAGGRIVKQPYGFPGGRRFHFTDPSGNELAVWSER